MMLFILMFMTVMGRFLYIETTGEVQGVDLNEYAAEKRTSSYQLDANRGRILDQNGMVLAYDRPTYRLYAIVDPAYSENMEEPMHVSDPGKTAEMLAPFLDMPEEKIEATLEEGIEDERFQVEFGAAGRDLSQQTMEKIKKQDIPGINFKEESKRYYPNGKFASHILGFARNKDGKMTGVTGIEKQMQEYLHGEPGRISYQRDKYGTELLNPNEVIKQPDDGENVVLTLDQKIQTFLEDAMTQVNKQYKPEKIMAAVMDPDTGEILALSNRPSYNPNDIEDVDNWYNDVISYPIEPGSTMKIFTWAAAMEAGVYNGKEKFMSGSYEYLEGERPIRDHNREGWGKITYDQGLRVSSNVAAAKLVKEKLGPETFLKYLKDFGFGQKTGIDLPGEKKGKILYNYLSEKLTTSYGQGTTATPIQLMTAATAIANKGKMMRPYVLSSIVDSESGEVIKKKEPEQIGKPVSAETAKKVRDLLGTVITGEEATGGIYELDDYSLAGKTGTSQIPDPETGGYMTGKGNYIYSFMGMAPKEDPELLIYVAVKQPELAPTEYGAEPSAYIVKTVLENSLHYLDIQPDQEKDVDVNSTELEDVTGEDPKQAKEKLSKQHQRITVIGDGEEVVRMFPKPGSKTLPTQRIYLVTDQPKMPDITGWSVRDVFNLADLFNLKVEQMGNGYVTKQSIKPGAKLKEDSYLVVEFQPPGQQEKNKESGAEGSEGAEEGAEPSEGTGQGGEDASGA